MDSMIASSGSTRLSSVAHNMVRKGGIVMATPRSIVDQVTVRLECLETGVDFEPPGYRCWPGRAAGGRYRRPLAHRGQKANLAGKRSPPVSGRSRLALG